MISRKEDCVLKRKGILGIELSVKMGYWPLWDQVDWSSDGTVQQPSPSSPQWSKFTDDDVLTLIQNKKVNSHYGLNQRAFLCKGLKFFANPKLSER